jgi:hypothetical protein
MDVLVHSDRHKPGTDQLDDFTTGESRRTVGDPIVSHATQWMPTAYEHVQRLFVANGYAYRIENGRVPREVSPSFVLRRLKRPVQLLKLGQ